MWPPVMGGQSSVLLSDPRARLIVDPGRPGSSPGAASLRWPCETRERSEVERVTSSWTVEMYADPRGHCPIQGWFDSLSAAKFAAIDAAIRHQLQKQGIGLAGTAWLKPLKDGLYEFRVRSTAAEIVRMYGDAGHVPPDGSETILLRVFVAFHGNRVVLLLDGYDKAVDKSLKRQQREIAAARKLQTAWKAQVARDRKHKRRGR